MKYIRTKEGIFDEAEHRHTIKNGKVSIMGIFYEFKQADTIEELCDEFVVEDKDEFAIFRNYKLAKQTRGIMYGAIWTDKGLIYVAKMNENGEFELL